MIHSLNFDTLPFTLLYCAQKPGRPTLSLLHSFDICFDTGLKISQRAYLNKAIACACIYELRTYMNNYNLGKTH